METLHNGFTLDICPGGFPFSTDSVALSGFVKLPKNARVLDLGSGCGTLGMLLCAADPGCTVTGVEISRDAHETALRNASSNGIRHRLDSICADLTTLSSFLSPGQFHCCVSNPPYFSTGPHSKTTPLARHDDICSTAELFRSAAWALKYGGDFFLVHKPEKLSELFAAGQEVSMEPKRICLLRHRDDSPVSLVLLQFRKGAKPGLKWEDGVLFHRDGTPTRYYKQLYHLQEET